MYGFNLINCTIIISTDKDPSLWIERFAIKNLHGVCTKLTLCCTKNVVNCNISYKRG